MINEIIHQAKKLGACRRIEGRDTYEALLALFYAPQGREFCHKHNFPSLELWRKINLEYPLRTYGIFIDCGDVTITNPRFAVVIGDTKATINYSGAEYIGRTLLQHGATAIINATNYAVIETVKDEQSNAIVNADKTVIQL